VLAVALALSSSLSWGLADFLGGLQARRLTAFFVVAASQAAGLVAVAIAVACFAGAAPPVGDLVPAALGGAIGAVGLGAFYRGLSIGAMSIVAPIAATGVAVPVAVGLLSGDAPGPLQVAGMALAICGVLLASREAPSAVAEARAVSRRSVGLALVAAASFGLFYVGLDASASDEPLWAGLAARIGSLALLGPAVLLFRARVGPQVSALPLLGLIGVLDVGANVLFAFASRIGLLSVVAVLGSLYPVITVLLARFVLHERVRTVQQTGVLVTLAGVVLLAAG
jgi:drug/metabolite transporter (DMT)-like permease